MSGPRQAVVFRGVELRVLARGWSLASLPRTQVHDAYDADRDGVYLRVRARFERVSTGAAAVAPLTMTVPGFVMRPRPGAPLSLRVRWAPRRAGRYRPRVTVVVGRGRKRAPLTLSATLPHAITARAEPWAKGPLVAPKSAQPSRYLRELRADGTSRAVWLFGAARAWNVRRRIPPAGSPAERKAAASTSWAAHSTIDRARELLAPMRAAGLDLLSQWMAPWEYLLVHHDRAEHWLANSGSGWRRRAYAKDIAWTSYQVYDQGRARAFDALVRAAEGDAKHALIRLLLAPLPHQVMQMRAHDWGSSESGFSPADDRRGPKSAWQHPSKLGGLSGLRPRMSAWQLFEASPRLPASDWRSQLFDHQANLVRYLVARWGYSAAIGAWVIVDELDGVGDRAGARAAKTGWWAHPACDRWLADMVRLHRGTLRRRDGLRYLGDPYRHPLHAATTSHDGRLDAAGNIGWRGGPRGARVDLLGWHFYPHLDPGRPSHAWQVNAEGLATYGALALPAPKRAGSTSAARLVSEYGAPDRSGPQDAVSALYPTLFEHGAWAAVMAGHAGTPLDWDDGKTWGELRWRRRPGAFSKKRYPVDKTRVIRALRRFLRGLDPAALDPSHGGRAALRADSRSARVLALHQRRGRHHVVGWLLARRPGARVRVRLHGLAPGRYLVRFFDPRSGAALGGSVGTRPLLARAGKAARFDATAALRHLRGTPRGMPRRDALARGQSVAFKIAPAPR